MIAIINMIIGGLVVMLGAEAYLLMRQTRQNQIKKSEEMDRAAS